MGDAFKWGFGNAPLKEELKLKNKEAVYQLKLYLIGGEADHVEIKENISIVKGLFNRIKRQDQWDWCTVNKYFNYPSREEIDTMVMRLSQLRKGLKENEAAVIAEARGVLSQYKYRKYLENYLASDAGQKASNEYIYILSSKEEKSILNIGSAIGDIDEKVAAANAEREHLLSPRKVYKVKKSKLAEKLIYEELEAYRVDMGQSDFKVSYVEACRTIEECLRIFRLYK